MHISAISSDNSQIMRALTTNNSCKKNELQPKQKDDLQKKQLYAAIVEWQRFCQQQLLKQKLDIIV